MAAAENDNDCLELLKKNDAAAWQYLIRIYFPVLCRFAKKILNNDAAADVVTDVFVKLWRYNVDFADHDWDGQEFLFNQGHGYYAVKRFHRKLFEKAASYNLPDLRIMGATLSEGSWHYQSVWNVGGGTNMYDLASRKWGSTTSEGKDLRDVAYSNYFPATFGINFSIGATSKVSDYEHIEAISVGVGATYMIDLSKSSVESCPNKYEIFRAIKRWENARAANAFPRYVKKLLADPAKDWQLEQVDGNNWKLYPMINGVRGAAINLTRDIAGVY